MVILWSDSSYTACKWSSNTWFSHYSENQLHLRMCFIAQMDTNSLDSLHGLLFPLNSYFFMWQQYNTIIDHSAFLRLHYSYTSLCCEAKPNAREETGEREKKCLCKWWSCDLSNDLIYIKLDQEMQNPHCGICFVYLVVKASNLASNGRFVIW